MTVRTVVVRAVAVALLAATALALVPDDADAQRRRRARRRPPAPPPVAEKSSPYDSRVLDDFEDAAAWRAIPASGVSLTLSPDSGAIGRALRLDFDFHGGGGYAVARRELGFTLPANYQLRFRVRGESPRNHLEFKLADSTGDNVWWHVKRDFEFPRAWSTVTIRRRQVEFAWGPRGGGTLDSAAAIEFAVTAGDGGRGSVWLDELELVPLPLPPATPPPIAARASSERPAREAAFAIDTLADTRWQSRSGGEQWLALDLGTPREFGALELEWMPGQAARDYQVEASLDAARWDTLRQVRDGDGGPDALWLPESEARHVRVRMARGESDTSYALAAVRLRPVDWAPKRSDFIQRLAARAPRGTFPRGFSEQVYWAVIGDPTSAHEALLSEDGAIECGKAQFSIEPFVRLGDSLVTWADVRTEQGGAGESGPPMPFARWRHPRFTLTTRANATGSTVHPTWELSNPGPDSLRATLVLAIRPFQVNPPPQFLNQPGGSALVSRLSMDRAAGAILVGDVPRIRPPTGNTMPPAGTTVVFRTSDSGGLDPRVLAFAPASDAAVNDAFDAASGALRLSVVVPPGGSRTVGLDVELAPDGRADAVRTMTRSREPLQLELPADGAELAAAVRANLDWIAINRDGPAIQPGSRSYERSWIRDGSLTSTALLRAGNREDVKAFLTWMASFQYGDGKVPCCVDRRGADPVPENDSHGQLIYLVAEYLRHSGDDATVRGVWPHVAKAARYLDSLRLTHRTPAFRAANAPEFVGLLPASISHEGYSAKPMHSYWDDLFGLRGFIDAAWLAQRFGTTAERAAFAAARDTFAADLVASYAHAMAAHRIDYLPGCAELGDFDATSTTVALSPVDAGHLLPRAALERTFERYWGFFLARRDSGRAWDGFTPYELRNVGAFVHLGWKDRAHELLDWFMTQRRPAGWQQWPEVVYSDPRAARFLGDLPHTWVGSDFIRSVLDLFAYERAADSALVVGAGVPERWVADGNQVKVDGLSTHYGVLGLHAAEQRGVVTMNVGLRAANRRNAPAPPGGIVVRSPFASPREVRVDGRKVDPADEVIVRKVPAVVTFRR